MDQGHADLFDPLLEGKEAGGGPGTGSDGVLVEDLLGGFSQLVAPDSKVDDAKGPATSSAHSRYWSIKWYGGRGRFDTPGKYFAAHRPQGQHPP